MALMVALGTPCASCQLLARKLFLEGAEKRLIKAGNLTVRSSPYPRSQLRASKSSSLRGSGVNRTRESGNRILLVQAAESTGNSSTSAGTDFKNDEEILKNLKELEDGFLALDADFLKSLPSDLQVDLKDAAFDCSNKVTPESSEPCEAALVRLGAALEARDSKAVARGLASLAAALKDEPQGSSLRAAVGKRLRSVGRRFGSMGSYGEGELRQLSRAFDAAGSSVAEGCGEAQETGAEKKATAKVFKFGDLQVAITRSKALTGAGIAVVFGAISGNLTSSLQSVTEDSMQYANDSALSLALSLRGTLLAVGYSCTLLSIFAAIGLVALGLQLSPEEAKE